MTILCDPFTQFFRHGEEIRVYVVVCRTKIAIFILFVLCLHINKFYLFCMFITLGIILSISECLTNEK